MPNLLTRETVRAFQLRHMAEYKTTEQIILLAQAEALEWAAELLWKYDDDVLADRLSEEAARLRKEAVG